MVRFVCAPEGALLADLQGRLPGRGAYCCWNRDCLTQAVVKRQFDRAFKRTCQPCSPDELIGLVLGGLMKHMVNLIGMARKSSQVLAGSNAVLDGLQQPDRFRLILLATDISSGVAEKIVRKAARAELECVSILNKEELGGLLGRAEHSVLALNVGQLADAFMADLHKYRDISGES